MAANCSPPMELAARRSTTRIATSRAVRCAYIRADEPLDDLSLATRRERSRGRRDAQGLRTKNLAEKIEALRKKRGR
jgi:hypothetical protein